jgi:hypothetical protein
VYFYDDQRRLIAFPARWTDVLPADPIRSIANGKSAFRADDLLKLVHLLRHINESHGAEDGDHV